MKSKTLWVGVCFAALVLSCARREPEVGAPSADADDKDLAALTTQLDSISRERETLKAGTTASPCPRMCDLADSICVIAEKICVVTSRHADRPEMAARCEKSRATCAESKEDCRRQCKK